MPNVVIEILSLIGLSLASLLAGLAMRNWPEKVQELSATLDGSIFLFGSEAHLRLVRLSGLGLIVVSYGALAVAATML